MRSRNLRIERSDGGAQALRDGLGVVLERRLRVRMPQVPLHILYRAMFLNVRGGCASERLLCQIWDADTLRERLQLFL